MEVLSYSVAEEGSRFDFYAKLLSVKMCKKIGVKSPLSRLVTGEIFLDSTEQKWSY